MRLEECSAKEFECYYHIDESSSSSPLSSGGCIVYARPADIPFAQRRKHKQLIESDLPVPAEGAAHPALTYMRGVGPYKHWNVVLSAIVVHQKCQIFIDKHIKSATPLKMYLCPFDESITTDRELRVYVQDLKVVAIGPWNPFGAIAAATCSPSSAIGEKRVAFPWVERLTDVQLAALGARVVRWVEAIVVPQIAAVTSLRDATVDLHVGDEGDDGVVGEPVLRLVETGPFGRFMAAGSTLFHWLEDDIFRPTITSSSSSDPRSLAPATVLPRCPVVFRVLTDAPSGLRLSTTKPVPKPDLLTA
jgi:hypothetical protein